QVQLHGSTTPAGRRVRVGAAVYQGMARCNMSSSQIRRVSALEFEVVDQTGIAQTRGDQRNQWSAGILPRLAEVRLTEIRMPDCHVIDREARRRQRSGGSALLAGQ